MPDKKPKKEDKKKPVAKKPVSKKETPVAAEEPTKGKTSTGKKKKK